MALSVADTLNTELDMTRTTQPITERHTTEVTEEKYQLLKRRLKEITEKNELLSNDLNRAKKRLRRLAKEKNILLERICKYDLGQQQQQQQQQQSTINSTTIIPITREESMIDDAESLLSLSQPQPPLPPDPKLDSVLKRHHEEQAQTMDMEIDDSASTVSDVVYEQKSQNSPPAPSHTHDLSPIPSTSWHSEHHEQPREEQQQQQQQQHNHYYPHNHNSHPSLPPPPLQEHLQKEHHHQERRHLPVPSVPRPTLPPPSTAIHQHNPFHHHPHSLPPISHPHVPPLSQQAVQEEHNHHQNNHHNRHQHHYSYRHHHHSSSNHNQVDHPPAVVPAPPIVPEPPASKQQNQQEPPAPPSDSPPLPQPTSNPSPPSSQGSSSQSSSPARPRVEVMLQDGRMVPSSRPKRMRRGPVEPKMRRVQPLEKDPVSGEYKLPARVGILTVHSLGRVVPLPTYHNDRYIWPPGFKVSRTYLSMVNPNVNTVYTCSVEENGEQGPRFRVVADDCPDQPIIANSATGVWTAIVKRANEIRHRDHSNSASGPDYYGFTHATIAKMIQDLPGTENCINYVWQKFGVMHQRTAAGVAAAAQKKLTNLEIMGSANKRPPPLHQQDRDDFTIMEHPEDFINGPLSTQEQRHHHHHAAEIELPRPQPVSATAAVAVQEPIRLIQVRQSSSTADT